VDFDLKFFRDVEVFVALNFLILVIIRLLKIFVNVKMVAVGYCWNIEIFKEVN
jgi:hypothetical protein